MFFELSKFLNFFLTPVTWVILLLLGTFVWKNRRGRRICLAGAVLVFVVFTNGLLADYVLGAKAGEYGAARLRDGRRYRVAVVMGGFGFMNQERGQMRYGGDKADRLWEAVRLYKMGRVEHILITGDGTSCVNNKGDSTADLFLTYMEQMRVPRATFILEQKARNTRENAVYTTEILKELDIRDRECVLITSAMHMKRSLGCFAKVGWAPDFFAVGVYSPPDEVTHRSFYPSWEAAVKWQEILNEWVGDCVYKIKGYS